MRALTVAAFLDYMACPYGPKMVSPALITANEKGGDSAQDWVRTGTWEPDPERFPGGLKEISDYVHRTDKGRNEQCRRF